MGGSVHTALDIITGGAQSLIRAVGKALGVYSHDKILSDIQISSLLTPGAATQSSRRSAVKGSGGDTKGYIDSIKAFQRNYRKKYSAQFLKSVGYAPSTSAETIILNGESVVSYLNSKGASAETLDSLSTTFISNKIVSEFGLQEAYNSSWSNRTKTLITDGKTWVSPKISNGSGTIKTDFDRLPIENIESYLVLTYDEYEGGVVTEDGDTYSPNIPSKPVAILENGSRVYKLTMTGINNANTLVATIPVESKRVVIPDIDYEVMYTQYRKADGIEFYHYVERLTSIPANLYQKQNIDLTAIIPLKEDNVIVDLENNKLRRMLKKLNIGADSFIESLKNEEIDNAYLMTGICPATADSQPRIKTMFDMFDLISEGSGNITIQMSQLNMRYEFAMDKSNITGVIGEVGTYTKTIVPTSTTSDGDGNSITTPATMRLRWQASDSIYKEIYITDYMQSYTISGQLLTTYIDGEDQYSRMVLPLDVMNKLRYKEFVDVFENSLCFLAYSQKTVRIKWYETGAFGRLVQIVGFVLTVITYGLAAGLAVALVGQFVFEAVFEVLGSIFGEQIGGILTAILAIIAMIYGGSQGLPLYLNSATVALQSWDLTIQSKMHELAVKSEAELEVIKKKTEELTGLISGLRGESDSPIDMFNDKYTATAGQIGGPEVFYSQMLGTGYNSPFNFDQYYDVDGAYASRKIVDTSLI